MIWMQPTPQIAHVDWFNLGSLLTGALVATITMISAAVFSGKWMDVNSNEMPHNLFLSAGFLAGALSGYYISYHSIGLVAHTAFSSMTAAWTASMGGALSGLTIYSLI